MGTTANKAFSALWRDIKSYHAEQYRVRLRVAANIIGFYYFPFGWRWDEYTALTIGDSVPYEKRALEKQNHRLLTNSDRTENQRLLLNAYRFRRHRVESTFQRFFEKEIVRIFEGPLAVPDALIEYGKIEKPLDRKDICFPRVEESQIGFRMYSRRVCHVDATDLMRSLEESVDKRGSKPKFDRHAIESWFRWSIEVNGLPHNHSQRIRELKSWCIETCTENEPPTKLCQEILASLVTEYTYVKKNRAIRL